MLEKYFEFQGNVLKGTGLDFQRYLVEEIDFDERLIGIVGARGVGKTTLLLQHYLKNFKSPEDCLYISADHIGVHSDGLFNIGSEHFKYGGRVILIDEIHKYPNWSQELKNIYDTYPGKKIIFSGSSMLDIIKGKYDLSRRAVVYRLPGLSFREYLEVSGKMKLDSLTLPTIVDSHVEIAARIGGEIEILKHFKRYLEGGYYPYFMENKNIHIYYKKLLNAVEKVLYEDLPSVFNVRASSIPTIKKLIYLVASTNPFEVNIDNIGRELSLSREFTALYIEYLQKAGIFNLLFPGQKGKKVTRKPEKIFLENPNLIYCFRDSLGFNLEIGSVRECIFVNQVSGSAKHKIFGSPKADFRVDDTYTFEIGGKSKRKANFTGGDEFIVKEGIESGSGHTIPLWLFGMLY